MSAIDNFAQLFSAGSSAITTTQNDIKEVKDAAIAYGTASLMLQAASTAAAVTMALIAVNNYNRRSRGK